MINKTKVLLFIVLFWGLSSCTVENIRTNQDNLEVTTTASSNPTPLASPSIDESLLPATKRPFFLKEVSPIEGRVIPLGLFNDDMGEDLEVEILSAWGEYRHEVGYKSEICVRLDVAHLGYENDTYLELSDLEGHIELRFNEVILTEITSFNSSGELVIEKSADGSFIYAGPYDICWKVSQEIQLGVQKCQFVFYTSKNELFSYEWQFRVIESE